MSILVVLFVTVSNKNLITVSTKKFIADIALYGKIKFICTDNGREIISCEFNDLSIKNKIKHAYACPYLPYENGTAERSSWHTLFYMQY